MVEKEVGESKHAFCKLVYQDNISFLRKIIDIRTDLVYSIKCCLVGGVDFGKVFFFLGLVPILPTITSNEFV
ncbi:Uncharacterised protein [Chlamydia trachomatis]|nr:Uncharacterised protein [Chlamydia trachomatis]CQB87174.1 Uncharacterised protein [Chlamydia trachomatis]